MTSLEQHTAHFDRSEDAAGLERNSQVQPMLLSGADSCFNHSKVWIFRLLILTIMPPSGSHPTYDWFGRYSVWTLNKVNHGTKNHFDFQFFDYGKWTWTISGKRKCPEPMNNQWWARISFSLFTYALRYWWWLWSHELKTSTYSLFTI